MAHFSVFIWRISEKIKYGLIKAVLFFEKSLTGWISSAVLSLIMSGKNKRFKKTRKAKYNNSKIVISEVYASFVLQCTVSGR